MPFWGLQVSNSFAVREKIGHAEKCSAKIELCSKGYSFTAWCKHHSWALARPIGID